MSEVNKDSEFKIKASKFKINFWNICWIYFNVLKEFIFL